MILSFALMAYCIAAYYVAVLLPNNQGNLKVALLMSSISAGVGAIYSLP